MLEYLLYYGKIKQLRFSSENHNLAPDKTNLTVNLALDDISWTKVLTPNKSSLRNVSLVLLNVLAEQAKVPLRL